MTACVRTLPFLTNFHGDFTMRRVIVPAVLALALIAGQAQNASAFGHLKSLFGGSSCDSCCEPVCGCEPVCEPVCGCEPVCEPVCGCEPICEPACAAPRRGLLARLFHKHDACCDAPVCEPVCGCEPICEPVCGCEPICEPACGCEPVCCDSAPRCNLFDGLKNLFRRGHSSCDCGCDVIEPVCGCEPSCGCGF